MSHHQKHIIVANLSPEHASITVSFFIFSRINNLSLDDAVAQRNSVGRAGNIVRAARQANQLIASAAALKGFFQ